MGRRRKELKYHKGRKLWYATYWDASLGKDKWKYFTANEKESYKQYIAWKDLRERTKPDTVFVDTETAEIMEPEFILSGAKPQEQQGPAPATQKLSDCLAYWTAEKTAEGRSQDYLDTKGRRFNVLVKVVGNKPINLITPADIESWTRELKRKAKKLSAKWHKDHVADVKSILHFVEARKSLQGWLFPAGLVSWIDTYANVKPYMPKAENAEPISPANFKKLLAAADKWAATPTKASKKTQQGRAKRLQAIRKQREGRQVKVMLLLGANASLDAVDLQRIQWSNLKLAGKLPYLDMGRVKQEWKTGAAIERKTPLLPATVKALKEWREESPKSSPLVFLNARGDSYKAEHIARMFKKLKSTAGVNSGSSYKHIRNIAPTLRKRNNLPADMSDAILGHVCSNGTSKYYEGAVDASYLLPLVTLVAADYF